MFQIAVERGIGVVREITCERRGVAAESDRFVDSPVAELRGCGPSERAVAQQAQLGIGVKTPVANPAAEEQVAALELKGLC